MTPVFESIMSPPLLLPLSQATLAQAAGVDPASVAYGSFVAWWKLLILLVAVVAFLRVMQWIDKDTVVARLPREPINVGLWALLVLALILVLVLPAFVMVLGATVGLLGAGVGGYLVWRNTTIGLADIPETFKAYLKDLVTPRKKDAVKEKEREEEVAAGGVTLMSKGGAKMPRPASDDEAARRAYDTAHRLLAEPLLARAERVDIIQITPRPATAETPAQARYGTKMNVDGVDHPGSAFDAADALAALALLKGLAGLDTAEQRKVQTGPLKARTSEASYDLELVTRGTRNGETATVEVDPKNRYNKPASQLGFSGPQLEQVRGFLEGGGGGLVLLAAPEGGGLDTLEYGMLLEHDAFTQHIVTGERTLRRELEGITQTVIGDNPNDQAHKLGWITDQQPDVLLADRPAGPAAAREILRHAAQSGTFTYVGLRADDVAGTLSAWTKMVGDPQQAVGPLRLVVTGRVLRKLCEACKVAYEPGDKVLAKLGVSAGKVRELYRARTEPIIDQKGNPVVCPYCAGLGYTGRTGAFEVMPVDDDARRQIARDPTPAAVKQLLRKANLRTLNEAAIRHVLTGKTDLGEVQRVLSGPAPAQRPGGGGAKPPAAKTSRPSKPAAPVPPKTDAKAAR